MNTINNISNTSQTIIGDIIQNGILTSIPTSKICLNPKNYRKAYDEKALLELSTQLQQHGVLSSIMLRPTGKDHYEVVVGERRFRAALIAELEEIPARVVELNDEQVLEVQLDENMQRENPHPLDEAAAIRNMLQLGLNIEEIALRLGKSKALIYNRIKLSELIPSFQDMFIANLLTISAATDLASLSENAQSLFFEKFCKNWKAKGFSLYGFTDKLNQYKFDLAKAPFDIKDVTLIEDGKDCTGCQFNSATLQSLFPDLAKTSICTNITCFNSKCSASLEKSIAAIIEKDAPTVLIKPYGFTDIEEMVLAKFPELKEIAHKNSYEIQSKKLPVLPKKQSFYRKEKDDTKSFDQKGYDQALEEFKTEMEEFKVQLENGKILKGLSIYRNSAKLEFIFSSNSKKSQSGITAKEVQTAIQNGSVTPELLQQEVERIKSRENRAKEIDLEKRQLAVHAKFQEMNCDLKSVAAITDEDLIAAKWLVFTSLNWNDRQNALKQLFSSKVQFDSLTNDRKYEEISKLDDIQFAFLIRVALAGKSESKYPTNPTGRFLHPTAIAAGVDINSIQAELDEKALIRQNKAKVRIADLQKQIKKLKSKK